MPKCAHAHGKVGKSCSILSLSLCFFSFPVCECSPVPVSSFWRRTVMEGKVLSESWKKGKGLCPPYPTGSVRGLQPGIGPDMVPNWIIFSLPSNSHRPSGADPFVALSGSPKCGLLSNLWTGAQEPVGSPDSQSRRTELIGQAPREYFPL